MTHHPVSSRADIEIGLRGQRSMELPLVAVLPFRSHADDILPGYFVDAITREVIASLGRLPDLRAVTAPSVVHYRDPSIDPRGIGRTLGADFVVTGHIVRSDQRLTFNQRLFDVAGGGLLWTDRFEVGLDTLHDATNWIVGRIAGGVTPHVREFEVKRALSADPRHMTAYDAMLRACDAVRSLTPANLDAASRLLERGMRLDPTFSLPFAWAALVHTLRIGQGWARYRENEAQEALRLASSALALDERNSMAMATCGHLHAVFYRRFDRGRALLDRAIDLCHSDALAWSLSGVTLAYAGDPYEASSRALHAIRLSPMDQMIHQFYATAALASYGCGDFVGSQTWARKALAENPRFTASHKILIASLVADGRINDARDVAADLRRLEPTFTLAIAATVPFEDEMAVKTFVQRLQTAGIA